LWSSGCGSFCKVDAGVFVLKHFKSKYIFVLVLILFYALVPSQAQNGSICENIVNMDPPEVTLDRDFYESQLSRYDEALGENPIDVELLNLRGDSLYALEQYDDAIDNFLQAIELDPTATYSLARLGDTYQQTFEIEAALAAYSQAIEIDPDYTYAYIKRGVAYRKIGDASELGTDATVYQMSLDDFNTALGLDRGSALAFARRSELYLSLKNLEQSFADAQNAINVGSEYAFAHTVMANLYKGNGDFSPAFASIRTALNTPTENGGAYAYAYTMAGEMCWRMGEREHALQVLDIAKTYDDRFSATDIVFARVAIDLRDGLEELDALTVTIDSPQDFASNLFMTINMIQLNRFYLSGIIRFYLDAADHNPTNPFVFNQLRYLPVDVSYYQDDLDVFIDWQKLAASFEPNNDDSASD
jgi:tetratricopeptide (TPR) repeat protein